MQKSVKEDREKYIGGSDIPVIMNLSPFKTRFDLLLEKAGLKEDEFPGNIYTEYGNIMEPKIRDFVNKSRGVHFREGKKVVEGKEDTIGLRVHTDGETEDAILEIKTTGEVKADINEYKLYLVQLLFNMMIEEKDIGVLAVYNRPEDLDDNFDQKRLQIFVIHAEDYLELAGEITKAEIDFIEDLKKVKENPFITEEELLPAEIPDITNRILAFEYQLGLLKEAEAKIKADKARLKAAMERAGVKSWKTPNGYKITLVEDGVEKVEEITTFDEASFKSDLPEIYLKYCKTKKKVTPGRAGYVKITAPKKEK